MKKKTNNKNFWGGRFLQSPSKLMVKINSSINFDKKLYAQDIRASKAHVTMLGNQKIISHSEKNKIINALDKIEIEIKSSKMAFNDELEDIHTHIEKRLIDLVGPLGKKLHTARSRNDQVATDMKLWLKEENKTLDLLLKNLQESLINKAGKHINDIMPGFTHLQAAQPITLAHHLLAYVNMFGRDRQNSSSLLQRHNYSPLVQHL